MNGKKSPFDLIGIILIASLLAAAIAPHIAAAGKDAHIQTDTDGRDRITVVIDAGHGGEDCGAIGTTGIYEKDINLEVALKLSEYLDAAGFKTVLTRTEDKLLYKESENIKGMRKISDLKNRVAIANAHSGAILISIHMNSFGDAQCKGLQTYYGTCEGSEQLANAIQSSTRQRLQPTNRRSIKRGEGLYLLENASIPAVIVECGFMSNPEECEKLSQKDYQKELSFSILCGIIEYSKTNAEPAD